MDDLYFENDNNYESDVDSGQEDQLIIKNIEKVKKIVKYKKALTVAELYVFPFIFVCSDDCLIK